MSEKYRELLLGCGRARDRRVGVRANPAGDGWSNLTTLDVNPDVKPDIVFDIDETGVSWPFDDNWFNEVHAYEVLEHLGSQGDLYSFFTNFHEIWRILKPGGVLCATVPSRYSEWLWGDPGHRRAILPCMLGFLDQTKYAENCDGKTPTNMSDYRYLWKGDFHTERTEDDRVYHKFVLRAIKPARFYK